MAQWVHPVRSEVPCEPIFFMAKDPAFLFYSNDFLSGTFTMSNEQVGKYIRLLCLQHQKNFLSENDMMKICGTYDEDIFCKFIKSDEGYYNERLKEESEKRKLYSESRRKNKLKTQNNDHIINISSSYVQHMENENENEIVNEIENIFGNKEICEIWKTWIEYKHQQFKFKYKNRKAEIVAIKNLQTLSHGKTHNAIAIINQSIGNGWKGFFPIRESNNSETRHQARVDYANRHNS